MKELMLMIGLVAAGVASAQDASSVRLDGVADQVIECRLDEQASAKIARDQHRRALSTESFKLRIEKGELTGKLGGRKIPDFNRHTDQVFESARKLEDGRIVVRVAEEGWDHVYHTISIDPKASRAQVSGDALYDCGSPFRFVGQMTCTVRQLN